MHSASSPHFSFFQLDIALKVVMRSPLLDKKDTPRRSEDRSTQTLADDNGWLVHLLVFGLRVFLVFFVAFAQAVVIVAGEKIPDTLFDQAIPVSGIPSAPQVDSSLGSLETPQATATSAPLQGYYVVFIGRDVGYTTSR